ncbi:T6SS immunity protein Tdi1 domain-containing protein, partial [Clostridium perfringens]|uniref:T6SS immunity protein Tdi1 domain-containing protein n=1 Tax=Clostridium perfringens TaxID=1502 RepID=UPI0037553EC5
EKLITAGKTLKENEVYSYKKLPVIGGAYSIDNIDPTDMSVHFAFSGQICEQIKDLPDGTKVNIKYEN